MKGRPLKKRRGFALSVTLMAMTAALVLISLIVFLLMIDGRNVSNARSRLYEKINIDLCGEEFLSRYEELIQPVSSDDDTDEKTYTTEYMISCAEEGGNLTWNKKSDGDEIPEDGYFVVVTVLYGAADVETEEKIVDGAVCTVKNSAGETVLTVKTDGAGSVTLWKYGVGAEDGE